MASSRPQRSRKGISYRDLAHGKGLKELSEETVHSPNVVKKNNSVGASKKIANVEKLQEKGTITVEDAVRTSQTDQDMAVNTVITITESGSKDADITNDVFEVMAAVISRSFLANIKTRKDRRVKDVISSLGASCVRSKGTYVVHGSEEAVLKVKTGLTWLALEDEMKKSQTATNESETKSTAHESEEISELQDTSHTSEPRDTSLTETENISAMDTVPSLDMDCTPAEEIRVIDTKESTSADQISHVTPEGIIGNSREEVQGSEQREGDRQGKDDVLSTTVETDASEALVFKEVPTTEEQQESQSGENRNDKEDIEKKETSDTKSGKSKLRVPKKDKPQSPFTVVEVRLSPRKRKPTERGKTYSKKAKRDSGTKKVHFVGVSNADPETQVEVVKDTKGEPVFYEEEEAALVFQDAMPEIILKDPNTNATEENEDTPAASEEPSQEETNQEDTVLIEIKPEKKSRTPKGKKPGWYIPDTTLCDICGFESSTPKGLYAHLRAYHGKRVRFECKICLRVFTVKNAHKRHVMTHFQKDMRTLTHLAAELHISALEEHKRTVELPPVLQAQLEAYKRGELGVLDPDPEANKVGKDGYVRGRMNREELPKGTIAWEEVPRSEWVPGSEAKIDAAATAEVPYDTEVGQEEAENEPKQATQILIQEELQTTEENVAAEDIKPSPEVAEGEEKSKEPDSQVEGTKDKVNVDPQVEGTKDKVNVDPAIADIFEPTEIRQDNDDDFEELPQEEDVKDKLCCLICSSYFSSQYYLDKHMDKKHSEPMSEPRRAHVKEQLATKFNKKFKSKAFHCTKCDFVCYRSQSFTRHFQSHSRPDIFKCKQCDYSHVQRGEVLRHERNVHGDAKHLCEHCDKKFRTSLLLRTHIKSSHTHEYSAVCDICGKILTTKRSLRQHMESQHMDDPNYLEGKILCNICGKVQQTYHAYTNHFKRCHSGKNTVKQEDADILVNVLQSEEGYAFACTVCDFSSRISAHVRKHYVNKHAEKKYSCPELGCDKLFPLKKMLDKHVKNEHSEGRTVYQCDECCKEFSQKSYLSAHILRVHEKRKKYQCEVCPKKFFSARDYKVHVEIHKPEEQRLSAFECPFDNCQRRFRFKANLNFHIKDHTGDRPFRCYVCSRSFKNKASLQVHSLSHKDERPYACHVCGKTFKGRPNLNVHLATHAIDKHICNSCGRLFMDTDTLKRHTCKAVVMGYEKVEESEDVHMALVQGNVDETGQNGTTHAVLIKQEVGDVLEESVTDKIINIPAGVTVEELNDLDPSVLAGLQGLKQEGEGQIVLLTDSGQAVSADHIDLLTSGELLDKAGVVTALAGEQESQADLVDNDLNSGEMYMCGICESIFATTDEVQTHMTEEHADQFMVFEDSGQDIEEAAIVQDIH